MGYASAATELSLYCENEYALHKMDQAIMKNLATKMAQGKYDRAAAVKAYMHFVEAGAKKYAKEFGGVWNKMFSVADRTKVATAYRNSFEAECANGACAHMLPAKYRKS